ncbi:MAG TPA: hypothetical protein P5092_21395 [Ruminococcus sp.]|nr:hypothetical protein [Ruminococcus sp.]
MILVTIVALSEKPSNDGSPDGRDVNAALNIRDEGMRMLSEQRNAEDSHLEIA